MYRVPDAAEDSRHSETRHRALILLAMGYEKVFAMAVSVCITWHLSLTDLRSILKSVPYNTKLGVDLNSRSCSVLLAVFGVQ